MRKILLYSLLLFWWCLMFPSNSYTSNYAYENPDITYSFSINNKEIRLKFLDLFTISN